MTGRWSPIVLVVGLQVALLALVPVRSMLARREGTEVTLRTRPVDPYDVLAGYYVTLAYVVEREAAAPWLADHEGPVFLALEDQGESWTSTGVYRTAEEVPRTATALRVTNAHGFVRLTEAERLYIPEEQREAVDERLRAHPEAGLVDLAVGKDGTPAVRRLRLGGQTFGD